MNRVKSSLEENSALVDKKTFDDMCQTTLNFAPYSVLYINTKAQDVNNMLYINFNRVSRLVINNSFAKYSH